MAIWATVTGNIGKDAELRSTKSGNVASFSLASSRKVRGADETIWVRVSIWGKRGETLVGHLTKGSKVAVTGELSTREHDGKTYVEVSAFDVALMGKPTGGGTRGGSQSGGGGGASSGDDFEDFGDGFGDVPF